MKRLLLLCLAAGLLALPATASASVALHGRAKIAVVYDGYANGLGDGLGNPSRPPSNAAISSLVVDSASGSGVASGEEESSVSALPSRSRR